MHSSARREKSDPGCGNGPNGFGLYAVLFWAHLEPSSIDARARQSFSFSSQNWPHGIHGSRAETRRENDAKSRYEI